MDQANFVNMFKTNHRIIFNLTSQSTHWTGRARMRRHASSVDTGVSSTIDFTCLRKLSCQLSRDVKFCQWTRSDYWTWSWLFIGLICCFMQREADAGIAFGAWDQHRGAEWIRDTGWLFGRWPRGSRLAAAHRWWRGSSASGLRLFCSLVDGRSGILWQTRWYHSYY